METHANNRPNDLQSTKHNPELERIANELAVQLTGYDPIVSATAPSVSLPMEKHRKTTHHHPKSPAN